MTTTTRRRAVTFLTCLAITLMYATVYTGFADMAEGTSQESDCDIHFNHSGNIPGSYDYAEFYEDGQLVTTVQTNGEDTFVNPEDYDAGSSWDQVNKCHNGDDTTTTTIEEETTTTQPEEETTTTTIPEETTTTTLPGLIEVVWSAEAICHIISAEWGEEAQGIVQINVTMRDSQFGDIEVEPFLEPGEKDATTTRGAEWVLVPVVETGYVAVPEQITLFTEVCEEETTTTAPPTTIPSEPTLPFTGVAAEGLIASGLACLVLGGMALMEARRRKEV